MPKLTPRRKAQSGEVCCRRCHRGLCHERHPGCARTLAVERQGRWEDMYGGSVLWKCERWDLEGCPAVRLHALWTLAEPQ